MKTHVKLLFFVLLSIFALSGCAKDIEVASSKIDDCKIAVNIINSKAVMYSSGQIYQSQTKATENLYLSVSTTDIDGRGKLLKQVIVNSCEKALQVEDADYYLSYWNKSGQSAQNNWGEIYLDLIPQPERAKIRNASYEEVRRLEKLSTKRSILENQNYMLQVYYLSTKQYGGETSKHYFCLRNNEVVVSDKPVPQCLD